MVEVSLSDLPGRKAYQILDKKVKIFKNLHFGLLSRSPVRGSNSVSVKYKEIQPVHSEEDQPWDFFGRNDAKAETPVLWPPHVKS